MQLNGRCYCGAHEVVADRAPLTVVNCHCADCRRVTGGAFGTFAAFAAESVVVTPPLKPVSHRDGVLRQFCPMCGSALTARFDYLPGQTYVPIGILDAADELVPTHHCHTQARLAWVAVDDGLPSDKGSARDTLNQ